MKMTRKVMVLILASITVTATVALVNVGLGHVWATRENILSMAPAEQHMNQGNHMNFDANMATHMNATQHMFGNIPDACQDMHDQMNMTDHMMGMH